MSKSLSRLVEAGNRIKELEYVVACFGDWYAEHGCPFTQHDICLGGEKDGYEAEQLGLREEGKTPFDKEYDCSLDTQEGSCWAKYYAKEWRDKQIEKCDFGEVK